jgi:CHAT domain-containing protein
MTQYLEFEIHIAPGSGQDYPVVVMKSPAGEATGTLRIPFDPAQLASQLHGIETAVRDSAFPVRGIAMDETVKASVKDFGKLLFEALFVDQVQAKFRMSQDRARLEKKGLRIRLRIEAPDLTTLPWEFLYDGSTGDYVALSSNTPVVRFLESDRPPETLTVKGPIAILAMVASPNDRPKLNIKRERERMEAATKGLQDAGLLRLDWLEGSSWRDLQAALRKNDYHIFHFVGHGGFDAAEGEGVLAFTNEDGGTHLMTATKVGRLLADEPALRLVVLNSCLGAKGNTTDVFSSTAATLVRRGVPAVIAMQYEISDDAAIEFSRSLYEALGNEMPVDAAVGEARKAISMVGDKSVEWGTPVLHMHSPDGELFKIEGTTTNQAKASGVYQRMPSRAELVAQQAAAPPASPALPALPAPGSPSWSTRKKAAVGAVGAVVLAAAVFGAIKLMPGNDSWAVYFQGVDGSERAWARDGATCNWIEFTQGTTDTQDIYIQRPTDSDDVELFNFNNNEILLFPRGGGWVSVDSGKGKGLINLGVRVTTGWEEQPKALPDCER